MPVSPTYPGVYVEEIPSGVRTITGVATSITAFVGRARRGPTDEPVVINNFGDFERKFGGLWLNSTMSFAVQDFYLNGGGQAIIVRLFHPNFATPEEWQTVRDAAQAVADAATGADVQAAAIAARQKANSFEENPEKSATDTVAKAAEAAATADGATLESVQKAAAKAVEKVAPYSKAQLTVGGLTLEAASPGLWGRNLRAVVETDIPAEIAERMGVQAGDLFNLTLTDGNLVETHNNLTVVESARRIDRVLESRSQLARYQGDLDGEALPEITAGKDAVSTAEDALKKAETADSPNPADITQKKEAKLAAIEAMRGSDGDTLIETDFTGPGKEGAKKGLYALEDADLFNLLCIPPFSYAPDYTDVPSTLIDTAAAYCKKRRALFIIDPPNKWTTKDAAKSGVATDIGAISQYAALFFPRLKKPNPLRDNQPEEFAPCGAIAGIFARTDTQRGVWKAPAGLEATLVAVPQLTVPLSNDENGELNPLGINCLRTLPAVGRVVWGSRTREGDDRLASEWKYIPVRRLALYIEESLFRGLHWVVFEPNDEPLWAQIRLNVGAFMQNLFRKGAFQGSSPREAYFVRCDKETTTQNDINLGIVNIHVGFAPLKPAEFVILKLQQMAGQVET